MNKQSMSRFAQAVYEAVRKIPRGKVATYSGIAHAIGKPRASRAVGNALNKNPFLPHPKNSRVEEWVPCHRVIRSDGRVGKYARGTKAKIKILQSEKVIIEKGRIEKKYIHTFHR